MYHNHTYYVYECAVNEDTSTLSFKYICIFTYE